MITVYPQDISKLLNDIMGDRAIKPRMVETDLGPGMNLVGSDDHVSWWSELVNALVELVQEVAFRTASAASDMVNLPGQVQLPHHPYLAFPLAPQVHGAIPGTVCF
ncbi:MAG: hypothetical protein AB1609_09020 [Bacillota bacterium]